MLGRDVVFQLHFAGTPEPGTWDTGEPENYRSWQR